MAKILLLEDEPVLAGLICSALHVDGHQICVHGGVQAGGLPGGNFDLILAEVNQGTKLGKVLSNRNQERKVMFMTEHPTVGEAINSLWQGVPVLGKPFTANELRRMVRETLSKEAKRQTRGRSVGSGSTAAATRTQVLVR